MGYLIPIIILFFLLWLIVLRPQRRRQMQQLNMQDELHLDDEIITAGGMHGYIKQLDESVLTIEIARGVRVRVDRRAIAGKVQPEEPEAEPEAIEAADESPRTERAES
jgi:preprotein translocase subunit YajC